MILDADHYRVGVKTIADLTRDKTDKERIDFIKVLSISTGIHLVICCVYVGELYGFSEELIQYMERLKQFYHITEVKNIREPKDEKA